MNLVFCVELQVPQNYQLRRVRSHDPFSWAQVPRARFVRFQSGSVVAVTLLRVSQLFFMGFSDLLKRSFCFFIRHKGKNGAGTYQVNKCPYYELCQYFNAVRTPRSQQLRSGPDATFADFKQNDRGYCTTITIHSVSDCVE